MTLTESTTINNSIYAQQSTAANSIYAPAILVENGVATLTGVVTKRFQKRAIEFAVKRLEGVSEIRNQLIDVTR